MLGNDGVLMRRLPHGPGGERQCRQQDAGRRTPTGRYRGRAGRRVADSIAISFHGKGFRPPADDHPTSAWPATASTAPRASSGRSDPRRLSTYGPREHQVDHRRAGEPAGRAPDASGRGGRVPAYGEQDDERHEQDALAQRVDPDQPRAAHEQAGHERHRPGPVVVTAPAGLGGAGEQRETTGQREQGGRFGVRRPGRVQHRLGGGGGQRRERRPARADGRGGQRADPEQRPGP